MLQARDVAVTKTVSKLLLIDAKDSSIQNDFWPSVRHVIYPKNLLVSDARPISDWSIAEEN